MYLRTKSLVLQVIIPDGILSDSDLAGILQQHLQLNLPVGPQSQRHPPSHTKGGGASAGGATSAGLRPSVGAFVEATTQQLELERTAEIDQANGVLSKYSAEAAQVCFIPLLFFSRPNELFLGCVRPVNASFTWYKLGTAEIDQANGVLRKYSTEAAQVRSYQCFLFSRIIG